MARIRGEEAPTPSGRPEGYGPEYEARDDEIVMRWERQQGITYDAEAGRRTIKDLLARKRREQERGAPSP